jgi:nucleoside permease NupC
MALTSDIALVFLVIAKESASFSRNESLICLPILLPSPTALVAALNLLITSFSDIMKANPLSNKSEIIASFALCGFANFSSIAIQVGGIGELAPERRTDLAKLGVKALICGTLASYLSATLAGIIFG